MQRRAFLSCLGLGLGTVATSANPAGASLGRATRLEPVARLAATGASWAGHVPGRIYLGMSTAGSIEQAEQQTGRVGLNRTFSSWGNADGEDRQIRADHSSGRLPWISFKPPASTSGMWSSIAAGRYDGDIRARARRYAGYSAPVIVTFNHEPQTDTQVGSPAEFAAAWTRIYDVWESETGLRNVAFAPIIGEWVFNPVNRTEDPAQYLSQAVLRRMAFLGVDLYQNPSGDDYATRLDRVIGFLDNQGRTEMMVGVGETGCSDYYAGSAADWWTRSWQWAASHADRIGAISYFNSSRNSRSGVDWRLDESTSKLNAFRASLDSAVSCRLAVG